MEGGDVVRVNYTGRIKESGELFDTTDEETAKDEDAFNPNVNYGPVTIITGAEMLMEALDEEILDMDVGDGKEVVLPPEEAFGERRDDLIRTFSEKKFKDQDMNPRPGVRVTVDGKVGRVLSVNSGRVRVDMNHPLAGRTLKYDVKIEDSVEGKEESIENVVDFYLGGEGEVEIEDGEVEIETEEEVREDIKDDLEEKLKEYLEVKNVEFETRDGEDEESE